MSNELSINHHRFSITKKIILVIASFIGVVVLLVTLFITGILANVLLRINPSSPVNQKVISKLLDTHRGLSESTVSSWLTNYGRIYEVNPCSSKPSCQVTLPAALRFSDCHMDVGSDYYNASGWFLVNCGGNFRTLPESSLCNGFFSKLDENQPDFTTKEKSSCKAGSGQLPIQNTEWVLTPALDNTANWKTYSNTSLGFSIKYPPNWTVDALRSDKLENTIVFDIGIGGTESRESIAVAESNVTADEWASQLDKLIVERTYRLTIDNQAAIRIDTTEFGQKIIATKFNGKLYIFTTGGGMIDTGMLATVKFMP